MKGGQFGPDWYQAHARQLRIRLDVVLNSAGVSVIRVREYRNFGQQLDKAKRTVHGAELIEYATALVESYAARGGLDRKVLVRIAREVFTLGVR